jgi:hypothetical protein
MSEISQDLMRKAGILPKLRLAIKEEGKAPVLTGPHTVKFIKDELKNGKDQETGKIVPIVRYIFEENGEKKRYEVPVKDKSGELHYLVQRLAEIKEGEELVIEMKKRGIKNYVSISQITHSGDVEVDEDEAELKYPDDIPEEHRE